VLPLERPRVYYGWVIVAVMAVVAGLTMALGTLNFGLFIKPMGDDLGIGRGAFGWAQSGRQLGSAVGAPFIGALVDRHGSRVLLPVAALVVGVALGGLAAVTEAWQIVALFVVMGVVGIGGPGSLITTVPVTKWFVRERGRALAYSMIGGAVGGLIFVPVTQLLIESIGWRGAWVALAAMGAGLIVPLGLIFLRRQPEDIGLRPDGALAPVGGSSATPAMADERSWTRAEALRSGTFWRLVAIFTAAIFAMGTIALHRIAAFADAGLDPLVVSFATALDAGAAGLASLATGMLTRRVPGRFIGSAGFGILAVASALTVVTTTHAMVFVSMVAFGLGIGVVMVMQSFIWASYFGRAHLGSITGAVLPITLIVGGAGAPLAGYVRDWTGSYDPIWLLAIAVLALAALALAFTPPPAHGTVSTT
jgi:MFS family permease